METPSPKGLRAPRPAARFRYYRRSSSPVVLETRSCANEKSTCGRWRRALTASKKLNLKSGPCTFNASLTSPDAFSAVNRKFANDSVIEPGDWRERSSMTGKAWSSMGKKLHTPSTGSGQALRGQETALHDDQLWRRFTTLTSGACR